MSWGWGSRSPTHPPPAPRLCGTIVHRHYVTACPPPRRRSSERSAAVIDRLSAGPYIRRREVGVPATVVPQLLQRCGWKTIQKWTFTGFCVAGDTASLSKPPARIGKISCTIFNSFFFYLSLTFALLLFLCRIIWLHNNFERKKTLHRWVELLSIIWLLTDDGKVHCKLLGVCTHSNVCTLLLTRLILHRYRVAIIYLFIYCRCSIHEIVKRHLAHI